MDAAAASERGSLAVLGGLLLALGVFLPLVRTNSGQPQRRHRRRARQLQRLGGPPDPALAAARRGARAADPGLDRRARPRAVLAARRADRRRRHDRRSARSLYFGIVDRPGEPSGEISPAVSAGSSRCSGASLIMVGGAIARQRHRTTTQATRSPLTCPTRRHAARSQPRPRARARDRGRRAAGRALRRAWATRRRPTRPPSTACTPCCDTIHMDGVVVIGEGEKDEAPMLAQRRGGRRRLAAAGRHRRRPARGHAAVRPRAPERARGDRALRARHDVRPRPGVYMEKMAGGDAHRRPARPRPAARRDRRAGRRAQGHRRRAT